MPREELPRPEGVFPTPFGDMAYKLNSADHVWIYAGDHDLVAPPILVNGVQYRTHTHLYRQEDGSWAKDPKDYSQPYMSRAAGGFSGTDGSPAARRKALEGITAAWEEYIFGKDLVLLEGERHRLVENLNKLEESIEGKRAELSKLEAEREALLRDEETLKDAYRRFGYKVSKNPEDWDPREPRRMP